MLHYWTTLIMASTGAVDGVAAPAVGATGASAADSAAGVSDSAPASFP